MTEASSLSRARDASQMIGGTRALGNLEFAYAQFGGNRCAQDSNGRCGNFFRLISRDDLSIRWASQTSGSIATTIPEGPARAAAANANKPTFAPTSHTTAPGRTS